MLYTILIIVVIIYIICIYTYICPKETLVWPWICSFWVPYESIWILKEGGRDDMNNDPFKIHLSGIPWYTISSIDHLIIPSFSDDPFQWWVEPLGITLGLLHVIQPFHLRIFHVPGKLRQEPNHILGMVVYQYTIYHHLPVVKGVNKTLLLINQPMGKGHLCMQLRWFLPSSAIKHQLHGA